MKPSVEEWFACSSGSWVTHFEGSNAELVVEKRKAQSGRSACAFSKNIDFSYVSFSNPALINDIDSQRSLSRYDKVCRRQFPFVNRSRSGQGIPTGGSLGPQCRQNRWGQT